MTPAVRSLVLGPPGWVPAGFQSGVAIDFTNDRYWGTRRENVVCSRASVAYGETVAGLWIPFASNLPVITDKGIAVWETRTNVALWCRDLTNATWTKTNVTAALDQTGIDGGSASASSITATASNGTCLQAITLASSARFQTAFVKRLTGSGTVEMTTDNGTTWTAVTVTSSWSRVSISTQTLANPTVGFRLATIGDAIAVDFVQNENGVFATSPILTTTTAVARAADSVTMTNMPGFGSEISAFIDITSFNNTGTRMFLAESNTNRLIYSSGSNTQASMYNGATILAANAGFGGHLTGSKVASTISAGGRAIVLNGGAVASDANAQSILSSFYVGSASGISPSGGFYVRRIALVPRRLSDAQLQAITA